MPQSKLTDDQKLHIAECYTSDPFWTQAKLAETYGVHRKTIYRALHECGVLEVKEVLSPGSARIVELVRAAGLDADGLAMVLQQPAMTRDNMVLVLAQLDIDHIKQLFEDVVQLKLMNNRGPSHEPTAAPAS